MAFLQLPLSPGGGGTAAKPLPRSLWGTNNLSDWGVPMRRALVPDKDEEEPSEAIGVKGRVPFTKMIGVPIDAFAPAMRTGVDRCAQRSGPRVGGRGRKSRRSRSRRW